MNQPEPAMEMYLAVLQHSLGSINPSDRNEIVSELRAHLHDSIQSGVRVDVVLARLGPSAELAAQHRENSLLEQANSTHRPWEMMLTPCISQS